MDILFTGASSFTGLWFVKELSSAGHQVTALFRRHYDHYSGLRLKRIDDVLPFCYPVFDCPFGGPGFMKALASKPKWDLFCHHAADVENYKSPDFNVASALVGNTHNLKEVLERLKGQGCQRVLLTGSVFEQNEGAGSDHLRAVSPYGLSKGLTTEVFKFYAQILKIKLGKFVIPNPFGPYEEMRFTSYLAQNWLEGKTAQVNAPEYVRDNIPVSLLAKCYADFARSLAEAPGFEKCNPSLYPESQGAFTTRFANELGKRLKLPCEYVLNPQTDFSEPKVRINTDPIDARGMNWDESGAWDDLAEYYQTAFRKEANGF